MLRILSVALEHHHAGTCEESEDHVEFNLPTGRTYLWHIHYAMEQIWLSSPQSGGRHFCATPLGWKDTRNGEDLREVVQKEIGVNLQF